MISPRTRELGRNVRCGPTRGSVVIDEKGEAGDGSGDEVLRTLARTRVEIRCPAD